jgi:hypothetical protein
MRDMAERKVTRLQFTENELTDEKVRRAAAKAERAADKAETAQSKLPKRTRMRLMREASGVNSPGSKLRSETQAASAAKGKLRFETAQVTAEKPGAVAQGGRNAVRTLAAGALRETKRAVDDADDGNAGTEALSTGKSAVEGGGSAVSNYQYSRKLKAHEKAEKLMAKSDKANVNALYQNAIHNDPDVASNPISRWHQKRAIRKQYEAARRTGSAAASGASSSAKGAAKEAKSLSDKALNLVREHPKEILIVLLLGFMVLFISSSFSSCGVMLGGGGQVVLGTSYTAEDEDITGADADYTALETALGKQIDNIETTHPGYDEYRYSLAEIGHNPYELASYLTVLFEDYTREEVQSTLQSLFDSQYTLTLTEEVEIRTRTETRTGTTTSTDPETGEVTEDDYEYEVEVEYEYHILNVTLTNTGISAVVRASGLTDDQLDRYDVLLETRGNRDDLFGDVSFAIPGEYTDYDIPGEALTDERFANMIQEAEKYLGYPYVWGGSSPSTSFDCSGFVSWVINNCGNGWSVGRLGAVGLKNICDIIPPSEAKPGDLIFFHHTYNAPDPSNATHVGIYVGNGMMIHCGSPISYTSIESTYWQEHFLCFGRLPA